MKMLKKGDTVGIICPSSYCDMNSSRLPKMTEILNKLGLNIKYGPTCYKQWGYLGGTDEERAKDIMDMFSDKTIDAIICMKGGYGASRIVDKLDYEVIRNNPKLFMGFSDITVLLNSIYQKCHFPAVHGQVGIFLGSPKNDDYSISDFNKLITCDFKNRILTHDNIVSLVEGTETGVLVGGNLSLIVNLIGSEYDIDFKNKIVFIEDVDEDAYSIDRMFCQLRLSNKLNDAKGFVLGHFTDCKEENDIQTIDNLIKEYFGKLNKPVITHFPSGHEFPFINIPIGLKVKLDSKNKNIKILERFYDEKS